MRNKRTITAFIMMILLFSFFACNAVRVEAASRNYNVVEERGGEIKDVLYRNQIKGTHNVKKSGKYTFAGKAEISKLYTNHFFTGKSSYEYRIENTGTEYLKVKLYAAPSEDKAWRDYLVTTVSVRGGIARGGFFDGLDPNMKYFIVFEAPSDFSGYVK